MRRLLLVACLILAAAATASAAPWTRLKTAGRTTPWVDEREIGRYSFFSEFPLNDVQELLQDLADLQADLETTLKLQCQPQPVQIHLFNNKRSYDQYVRVRVPEGVNRKALYVPGNVAGTDPSTVYAFKNRDLETDVRHETTHALLHSALPYVPIWIDEGLAEYFEVPQPLRVKGHSHRAEIKNAIYLSRWKPNIEKLESKRKLMDMDGQDYRDSWGIVHFLLNGPPEAREALFVYFEQIQSGDAPTPLSQSLRKRIPHLEQEIIDHLKK